MDKSIKVSIIIPLYNTPEAYFKRCIDSISSQQYTNYEIIVIDDGSRNELSAAYEKICSSHKNILFVTQENSGVSSARNRGITLATGYYIAFVDGDDTVAKSFLAEALRYTIEELPDLIIGQIQYIPNNKAVSYECGEVYINEDTIADLKKAILGIPQNHINYPVLGSPCGRLYKKEILKDVRFPEGVSHWEDQLFNRSAIEYVKCAVVASQCWYNYYQNDFSAMHNNFNQNYIANARPFWALWNEMNIKETDIFISKELYKKNINFFYAAIHLNLVYLQIPWSEKRNIIKKLSNEPIFLKTVNELQYGDLDKVRDKIRLFGMKHKLYAFMYFMVKQKMRFE
ncbi:glycosyltransferase involved in cell wall biosynthesis [Clostridium pascui]|uniref:glycosyltransferase family 2 protein n=1 Tax=Clostridium pascui TaxID=46609 RepID=UPI00195F1B00|nr:glycosyltransferase family 2 protein [Clostridium pascui]MBM7869846.1 glycosyltransferase involved in cell wall biosynthesis [Clostridium pascui]